MDLWPIIIRSIGGFGAPGTILKTFVDKILDMENFLTIISGVVVFVLGQYVLEFVRGLLE